MSLNDNELASLLDEIRDLKLRVAALEVRASAIAKSAETTNPDPEEDLPFVQPLTPEQEQTEQRAPINWPTESGPATSKAPPEFAGRAAIEDRIVQSKEVAPPTAKPPAPSATRSLESDIGENWASWIGGIVFLIGVCFFLKYAWDKGWIRPTPAMRVIATLTVGAMLCGFGEWAHRKLQGVLGATLYGVGIATLMAGLFGANVYFDEPVIGRTTAFVGVAIVALLGVWSSVRINAITLAIIALLGAYLSPAILSSGQDRSLELITYLGAATAVGLGVSYFRVKWFSVRLFCWIACLIWTALWLDRYGLKDEHFALALAWHVLVYGGFLGQIVLSLHKIVPVDQDLLDGAKAKELALAEGSLIALSVMNSASVFAGLWAVLDGTSWISSGGMFMANPVGAAALGMAAVQAIMIFATPSLVFARASMVQAMGFVTIAVPLVLGEHAVTIAWMVLALAIAVTAKMTNSRAMRGWATTLAVLAVLRLFILDIHRAMLNLPILNIGELSITRWTILAIGAAILCHLSAWLGLDGEQSKKVINQKASTFTPRDFLAGLGTAIYMIAWARSSSGNGSTTAWLLLMGILIALLLKPKLNYLRWQVIGVGLVITAKWAVHDGIYPIGDHWEDGVNMLPPILNLHFKNGLVLAGLIGWFCVSETPRLSRDTLLKMWTWFGGVLFLAVNFEVCRAADWLASNYSATFDHRENFKHVSLSVTWALIAFGLVIAGFWKKIEFFRWAGLGLLTLTVGKVLLVDMADVSTVYRILSFLVTGGLLLAVSFAYHRHSTREA